MSDQTTPNENENDEQDREVGSEVEPNVTTPREGQGEEEIARSEEREVGSEDAEEEEDDEGGSEG